MRHAAAATVLLVATTTVSLASAEAPARLEPNDPLTRPAPALLEPMRFAVDHRAPAEKIQPTLWQEALERGADATIPIIITLHEPLLEEALRGFSADADAHRVQWVAALAHDFAPRAGAAGLTNIRALSHFPILFGSAHPRDLARLAALDSVRALELDSPIEEARLQGASLIKSDLLRTQLGGNGTGIGVAIVDSGVDNGQPELASRVVAQGDFTGTTGDGTIDGTGHGTAVAGIVAGTTRGMARNATLWALKVFRNDGSGDASMVISALNSAYSNRNQSGGLEVVNMSLGIPGTPFNATCDAYLSAMTTVVDALVAQGIAVFVASGNDGFKNGVSFPSCLSKVVAVGAVYDANIGSAAFSNCSDPTTASDQITCYSNSGVPLAILAPSHCADTTGPAGSCFGGTSAASPYAAGVAAQILSLRPSTTPAQLKNALVTTGRSRGDVNGIMRRRIDAVQAYQALAGSGGSPCVEGPNTACLLGDRFKVEIQWTDFQAVTRDAFVASAGTPDSALFYWTNPNNWEFLIKGVNACGFNNKFWIFFAAATNVGYRVTVTDTVAGGAPRVYTNPVGNLAQAVNDINAFNCP